MGIFDKARSTIAGRFGDETVRKGNFGARDEDEQESAPRGQKLKRAPRQKPPREAKPSRNEFQSDESEDLQDGGFENGSDSFEDEYSFETRDESSVIDSQAFSALSTDQGQSVEEILGSMRIEETFTIDEGILFIDEELANQQFATQAPYGYDMGEVDYFLTKTQRSIAEYVKLLRRRNDDVVKLASRISDMSVEINNMRFSSEVANGINIMASGGDEDSLAVDLQEARSRAQRLQERLDMLEAAPRERDEDELEILRNELAAERRSREGFEAEAADLRAHLVLIEEEYDIQVFSDRGELQQPNTTEGYDSYSEQRDGRFQEVSGIDSRPQDELYAEESSYQKVGRDHWLPESEEDEGLPDMSYEEEGLPDGSFEFEEQSLAELPLGSFEDGAGGFDQTDDSFQDSAFTANPYQNLDEFIEENSRVFPDDPASSERDFDTVDSEEDPDEDGFNYSFERK